MQDPGLLDAPGEPGAEPAERERGEQLARRERVDAVIGEEPPDEQPERADGRGDRGRLRRLVARACDRGGRQHEEQEQERERARREGQRREHAEDREPAPGERDERGECEREAEPVGECGRDDRGGGDEREEPRRPDGRLAPGLADHERERGGRGGDAEHREQPDPDDRGERVVEDAVADEGVAARVPVVRPEREAVLQVDVQLEDVGGEVGARRPEPGDQGGERPCEGRVHQRLARSKARQRHRSSDAARRQPRRILRCRPVEAVAEKHVVLVPADAEEARRRAGRPEGDRCPRRARAADRRRSRPVRSGEIVRKSSSTSRRSRNGPITCGPPSRRISRWPRASSSVERPSGGRGSGRARSPRSRAATRRAPPRRRRW